ncbi:MAG: hypothetical protein ABIA37_04120 [Candidatus Woesearchaeota archaeon]
MAKKGMSAEFIVGAIITLAAFVLITLAIRGFIDKAESKEVEIICHDSVALRSAASISLGGLENAKLAPLLCKTQDRKISGTEEEVQKQMAEMIARCWWMFNAGMTEDLLTTLPGLGGNNQGFVCYTALVEGSKEFSAGNKIIDFNDFLRKEKYAQTNITYLNYVQYAAGGPGRIVMLLENGIIQPNHAYEIAFIEKNSDKNSWIGTAITGAGAAAAITGVIIFSVGTGGLGAAALAVAGVAGTAVGTEIQFDQMFKETDVSTVMVIDMSNQDLRNELHKNVFSGDISGE